MPKIADKLFEGVDGNPLINEQTYEEILTSRSKLEANQLFLRHLMNSGTLNSVEKLCEVLQNTSQDHNIHQEIANILLYITY